VNTLILMVNIFVQMLALECRQDSLSSAKV
jgi:hypothetical protein